MTDRLNPDESRLLVGLLLAVAVACWSPTVSQYLQYHAFADQRPVWGLPHAMDVLSNLPFAIMGVWGLSRLQFARYGQPRGWQRQLTALFFCGLIVTALCSGWYHISPDDAGLAIDRLGMVLPFAGLLGLAVADRVSARAGAATCVTVLGMGPLTVAVWAHTANLMPWAVLQGGGMLLLLVLAVRKPLAGAWGVPLGAVLAYYVLAKFLEGADHFIFTLTHLWVSGHTLKHLAAALAAWPLIALMHNGSQNWSWQHRIARGRRPYNTL